MNILKKYLYFYVRFGLYNELNKYVQSQMWNLFKSNFQDVSILFNVYYKDRTFVIKLLLTSYDGL